jgi:hypothetical protein
MSHTYRYDLTLLSGPPLPHDCLQVATGSRLMLFASGWRGRWVTCGAVLFLGLCAAIHLITTTCHIDLPHQCSWRPQHAQLVKFEQQGHTAEPRHKAKKMLARLPQQVLATYGGHPGRRWLSSAGLTHHAGDVATSKCGGDSCDACDLAPVQPHQTLTSTPDYAITCPCKWPSHVVSH